MTLKEILFGGGSALFVLLTLLQLAPIKINPWSRIAKTIGNAMNAGVMDEIKQVKTAQEETRKKLDDHIEESEERKADNYKSRVLRFNNELVRGLGHTEEDYNEILDIIWKYENYCKTHENYQNNKMPHAIKNVERMYDEMLKTNGFLKTEE